MKEIITKSYVAEDGTKFNNRQECEEYEAKMTKHFPHIHLFNYDTKLLRAWENDKMYYVLIEQECPQEELKDFVDYVYDDIQNIDTVGTIYAFSQETEKFYDIKAAYNEIEKNLWGSLRKSRKV